MWIKCYQMPERVAIYLVNLNLVHVIQENNNANQLLLFCRNNSYTPCDLNETMAVMAEIQANQSPIYVTITPNTQVTP